MTFQPPMRTPRGFGKGPAKSRPKAKPEKHLSVSTCGSVEERILDSGEVADRTINRVCNTYFNAVFGPTDVE